MPEMNCMGAFPESNVSLARKLGSEFLGTFIMVFTAAAAPIVNQSHFGPTATPATVMANGAAAGLAVLAVILATGHISGAHINPAVTFAFASLGHFPWAHVVPYAVVQTLGSISAGFALKAVYEPYANGGITVPTIAHGYAFAHEFIITFVLMFVVMAVSTDTRAVGELAAIAVSGTVLLNNLIAGITTGGSMNPVRTLGPAVASGNYNGVWIYMLAPPLGALAGAAAYTAVKLSDKTLNNRNQVYNNDCNSHDGNASSSRYEPPSLGNGLVMV